MITLLYRVIEVVASPITGPVNAYMDEVASDLDERCEHFANFFAPLDSDA